MFHAVGSLGSTVKLQEENRTSYLEKILRLVTLMADSQQLSPWAGMFLVLASAPPPGAFPSAVNSPLIKCRFLPIQTATSNLSHKVEAVFHRHLSRTIGSICPNIWKTFYH